MSVNGQNYFANMVQAPQILQGSPNYNVEVSEGQTPPGEFYPAQYLPTVLSENRLAGSAYVLMPGKVVAYDSAKRLVPAGLAMEYSEYKAAFDAHITSNASDASAPTATDISNAKADSTVTAKNLTTFNRQDIEFGVISADGAPVIDGDIWNEMIVDNLDTFTAGQSAFTDPVGIMRYSALMAPGSNPSNPTTFTKHAYDTGGARAYTRWAYIQVPVVEVNTRRELATEGDNKHRMRIYSDGAIKIVRANGDPVELDYGDGLGAVELKQKHSFTDVEGVDGEPTYFTVLGRTVLFNGAIPADWYVEYAPKVDLPFTCVKYGTPGQATTLYDSMITNPISTFVGEQVGFDMNSNFAMQADITANGYNRTVGRILDIKNGSNDDLKLVRSYFRDSGLWQEQPGSATDGRNTQLSIVNAPKHIVRIAVNFESNFSLIA